MNRLFADRRSYRKGLALGMTVAEIFSIIVFVLLLVLAMHVGAVQGELDEAKNARESFSEEMLQGDTMSVDLNTLNWVEHYEFVSEKLHEADSLINELETALDEGDLVDLDSVLVVVRDSVRGYAKAFGDLPLPNGDNDVRDGDGGPPPCWDDADGNPEYLFEVTLQDAGFVLREVASPANQQDVEAMERISGVAENTLYTPSEFLAITRSIYNLSRERECRFWVRPVDETGSSKEIYKERGDQLGQRFYYRW